MKKRNIIFMLLLLQACGRDPQKQQDLEGHAIAQSSGKDASIEIMSTENRKFWKPLLPKLSDPQLESIVQAESTLWYDKESIVPGYQDSMGDPVGMRPNTIEPVMIDTAVPGGHARLFAKRGRFQFPFGTGGIDNTTDVAAINFWAPPKTSEGKTIPVAYWSSGFTRIRWLFPVGTVLGEVLFMKFPDGAYLPFEVRLRIRQIDDWDVEVLRPFPTAVSLANAIKKMNPDWSSLKTLSGFVEHLMSSETLTPRKLETRFFPGSFEPLRGFVDTLPDAEDPQLMASLLRATPFVSVKGTPWKQNGADIAYGAVATKPGAVFPRQYDGALFPPTKEFCNRCHTDAGRGIGDWHSDLVAYGELWGEDRTFSWHPFATEAFVDPKSGGVRNFNYNNRRIREDFQSAGLIAPQKPNASSTVYRELARAWEWHPF